MSLIPAFELGLWNAWLFNITDLALWPIGSKVLGGSGKSDQSFSDFTRREKLSFCALLVIFISNYVYSIFLPLKLGTVWFYTGFFVYLVGITIEITAMYNFATTSRDTPVTKGVYSISRNPMYIGEFLAYTAISIACISWVYLVMGMALIILRHTIVMLEEKELLSKYGDTYQEYLNRTPRWIGIPKSEKGKQ